MTHIATLYTHKEGRLKPNLIRYFWDAPSLTLLQQEEYLIDGIHCPEDPVKQDPSTAIWNAEEALEVVAGMTEPGMHHRPDGSVVVVY